MTQPPDGGLGLGAPASPNAWLRIGAGTGSLTDNGGPAAPMGFKVKVDSAAGQRAPDGGQINVNIVEGTTDGATRGLVARIDVNDDTSAGDTVALWGDVFVNQASPRPTWGQNTYVQIAAGVAYAQAAIGAELGVFNDGSLPNSGGVLHLVSRGASTVRFGLLLSEALGGTFRVEHGILMQDQAEGPSVNALYFGRLAAGNTPTGVPRFQVSKDGVLSIGNDLASAAVAFQLQRLSNAQPRLTIANDGSIAIGNGTTAPDAVLIRAGAGILGTQAGKAFWLGTATGNGGGHLQGWEQSADPSAPAAGAWRLYAKNVGGKTQLGVLFNTGAFVPIASQP